MKSFSLIGNRLTSISFFRVDIINKSVLQIFVHPCEIEFVVARSRLLLPEAGCGLHYLNFCSGDCGLVNLSSS